MKLVEGITPGYSPSIRDISVDLLVFGDLASTHTSVRGGAFKVLIFSTLPYCDTDLRLLACASVTQWFISFFT